MRFESQRCDLCGRIREVQIYNNGILCTDPIECVDILDNRYEGIPWASRKINQQGADSDC